MDADELVIAIGRYLHGRHQPLLYTLPSNTRVSVLEEADDYAEHCVEAFLSACIDVVGLDIEWASSDRTIALVQLAAGNECLLMRPKFLTCMPQALRTALEDNHVLKCGVGIAQDLQLLDVQLGINVHGAVELSALAAHHDHVEHGLGLAGICRSVLGKLLPKQNHIRCSNWAGLLTEEQIQYAACDATVAVDITKEMHRQHAAEAMLLQEFCQGFIDVLKFPRMRQKVSADGSSITFPENADDKVKPRSVPLYDGCRMLAPNGTHMASVRRSKADWYIRKGLAVCVCEDPFSFQLLYEPTGLGQIGSSYNLQKLMNQCVSCSSADNLVRFYVVPHSFRAILPLKFKAYSSHDILLLCKGCFRPAAQAVARRRQQLLRQHGIADGGKGIIRVDWDKKKYCDAARVLGKAKVPQDVRQEKLALLRNWFGKADEEAVTEEEIQLAAGLEVKSAADDYVSAERQLFAKLQLLDAPDSEARCQDFVVSWRQLFLETLHPQHLPARWDVNHVVGEDRQS
mmetsp:Transcript_138443/g.265647  ORF Transcript_138443/g.265647 Transcript_138443/m.265647 type:complete len:514 (-) Transcript_138443:34-1575(-)